MGEKNNCGHPGALQCAASRIGCGSPAAAPQSSESTLPTALSIDSILPTAPADGVSSGFNTRLRTILSSRCIAEIPLYIHTLLAVWQQHSGKQLSYSNRRHSLHCRSQLLSRETLRLRIRPSSGRALSLLFLYSVSLESSRRYG